MTAYLMISKAWLYVEVTIDLHSGAVIGWLMDILMTPDFVCNALNSRTFVNNNAAKSPQTMVQSLLNTKRSLSRD
ncbi:MAG: transposase InsO family protein [Motiliproteus sp.]